MRITTQTNTIFPDYTTTSNMEVVVKATEIFCPIDAIFKATDGKMYYIDGGRNRINKDLFGTKDQHADNDLLLEWINENPLEWIEDEA